MEGTQGRIPGGVLLITTAEDVASLAVRDANKLSYVTQTTLSVAETRDIIDALKKRYPKIVGPDVKDICYATQNRQQAVRDLASQVDLLLVVGASNSSNSNRLRDVGVELGKPSYLVEDADALDPSWLDGVSSVGVTAGASAPEELVQGLIRRLADFGEVELCELAGVDESIIFKLPSELAVSAAATLA